MAKTSARKQGADPLASLEQDHRSVEQLFERLGKAKSGAARFGVFLQIKQALGLHATLEEQILYPAVRSCPDLRAQTGTTRAYDEHDDVKTTLAEIEMASPEEPIFLAKCALLEALVAQHVAEEEEQLFPLARKLLGSPRLEALGRRLARAAKAEIQVGKPAPKARAHGQP